MPYVTQEYYERCYKGEIIEDENFPALISRAEEIVEEMSMYRLNGLTFHAMPEDIQERVKKAICAQMEYLDANGGSEIDTGGGLQSASLGKFSYSSASVDSSKQIYAPRALRYLMPTGLLYRGGG